MDNFTHIVVGAGSAGCVVASRLANSLRNNVLLVEAGPNYRTEKELPLDVADASVPSQRMHDWGIVATGTDDRTLAMIRGKLVGGSSAVNACIALRAEPNDFKNWPRQWSWNSVLPYYIRLEADRDFPTKMYHGDSGPLPIRRWKNEELHPLSRAFLKACAEMGYDIISDHNKPRTTGSGVLPMNAINGRRISTADAYLRPIQDRKNLTVLSKAVADRILFKGVKAIGVSIATSSGIRNIFGDQIILCAGTFGTPAVLLRSGIGPSIDLATHSINLVKDLPGVGANLTDHSQVPVGITTKVPHVSKNLPPCIQTLLRYSSQKTEQINNMQICLLNQVDISVFTPYLMDKGNRENTFFLTSNLMLPKSRGKVGIKNVDPHENPLIEMDFCASKEDMQCHREGLRRIYRIVNSKGFDTLRGSILEVEKLLGSDQELDAFIQNRVQTAHHPSGTAKMGTKIDPMAVVDSNCAVFGIEGLYIADASIIPEPIRANTNLTCIMIGERLADLLLAQAAQ